MTRYSFYIKGKRKEVHTPILKFVIILLLILYLIITMPLHLVCRFLGFRGFYNKTESSYTVQNPFRRTEHG